MPQGLQNFRRKGDPIGGEILGDREYQKLEDSKVLVTPKPRGSQALGDAGKWKVPGAGVLQSTEDYSGSSGTGSGRTK